MRIVKALLFSAVVVSFCASAQTTSQAWDNSGNGMLNGPYYIRQVLWQTDNTGTGSLNDAASIYGEITFSGTGTYTFSGQVMDPGVASTPQAYTTSGTYTISASGYGFMDSLLNGLASASETIFGLVSQGIFIGSSTENLSGNGINDLAIAAPISSAPATNATFKGSYSFVDFDSPTGSVYDTRDSLFTLTADGNGNLTGTTAGSGYIAANGSTATRQNFSGVKYAFSNGGGNIFFGGSLTASNVDTALLAGNHYVYISPDGNFIFGGSPIGWDMFVGVRNGSGAPSSFNGLYYQAGMDMDVSNLAAGTASLDSYFGSFKASSGIILNHQRVLNGSSFDFTFKDGYTFNTDGSSDSSTTVQHYIYGLNGALRIGIGTSTFLGVNVALAAPSFSGPGVYLNPTGIVNSASFALFTAQIVPGEFITLFGTGLSSKNDVNPFFPTTLDGVQVLIDGVPAPIYYVLSSGAISVLVPYETPAGIANIQVVNNNAKSNVVSVFAGDTQPGIFTQTSDGVGYVIAQHTTDFSNVTTSKPAQPGETIVVYMTGLGAVTPAVPNGTITPSSGLTSTTNTINAYIGGVQAAVAFAGLTPGLIGLYQMNITVPTGLTAGDNILEITGPDSDNYESKISIGSGSLSVNAVPEAKTALRPARPHWMGQSDKIFPAGKKSPADKIQPLSGHLTGK